MRQPKFRGFNKEENKWYYGHGWFKSDYTEEYKQEKGIEDTAIIHTDYSPVECELSSMGEFTGLKDKNKVEIYIGDIIKHKYEYNPQVVEWSENICCYKINAEEVTERYLMKVDEERELMEVIGNIYENPELIKLT